MKTNVRTVSYKTGKDDPTSDWWTWTETCDRCGKPTETNGYITRFANKTVNTEESDYCLRCLRELIDAKYK